MGFEIERASSLTTHSQEWERIGFIEGHGNSNSPKDYSFTDKSVTSGKYFYRLKQIDSDGKYEYSKVVEVTIENKPSNFELAQNYPNPFNPSTTIQFQIPKSSFVNLKVYDILGKEVATLVNEEKPLGTYEVTWYAEHVPSGVYFYRIQAGNFVETKKLVLLK